MSRDQRGCNISKKVDSKSGCKYQGKPYPLKQKKYKKPTPCDKKDEYDYDDDMNYEEEYGKYLISDSEEECDRKDYKEVDDYECDSVKKFKKGKKSVKKYYDEEDDDKYANCDECKRFRERKEDDYSNCDECRRFRDRREPYCKTCPRPYRPPYGPPQGMQPYGTPCDRPYYPTQQPYGGYNGYRGGNSRWGRP